MNDWQTGYRQALTKVLLKNGDVLKDPNDYYASTFNYVATRALQEHAKTCEVSIVGTPESAVYDEFVDTYAPAEEGRTIIIEAELACDCGEIKCRAGVSNMDMKSILFALLGEG